MHSRLYHLYEYDDEVEKGLFGGYLPASRRSRYGGAIKGTLKLASTNHKINSAMRRDRRAINKPLSGAQRLQRKMAATKRKGGSGLRAARKTDQSYAARSVNI